MAKVDLMVVSWDDDSETWEVCARNDASAEVWSTWEGTEDELDQLMSLARDVMTGG